MKWPGKHMLGWLWRMSQGIRLQALLNMLLSLTVVASDFAFIWATKRAIDIATGRLPGASLLWTSVLLVSIMALKISMAFANRWIAAILGVRSQNMMRMRLFRHLLFCKWNTDKERHSGDVLNRLERDVDDVTATLTETIPDAVAVLFRLCGAFVFLYSMAPSLALIVVFLAPAFILLSKIYVKKMRAITHDIRSTDSEIQSIMQESVQNHLILKTLGQSPHMVERLRGVQQTLQGHVKRRVVFSSVSATLLNIGFVTGYLVTFLWSVYHLQQGLITYGMMTAFIQLVGQIQGPFRDLARFIPIMVSSLTAAERIMELAETPLEQEGDPILFRQGADVVFDKVTYAYQEGSRKILKDFSCVFPKGSCTAVLGETGAGKTTLVRLILGLVTPLSGKVQVCDETRCVEASSLTRDNFMYVPQGNALFSGTIRENLLMGDMQASEQDMWDALHVACADFVKEMPDGLDSRCGEQGIGLSQGQAQRIAIARALLHKGSVCLLDEATSALDVETERQLLHNLMQAQGDQTIICITHRTAVVDYASQVVRIERLT